MSKKNILRGISLLMFAVAVTFLIWTQLYSQTDMMIYIGVYIIDPDSLREMRGLHIAYLISMFGLFLLSFFTKEYDNAHK